MSRLSFQERVEGDSVILMDGATGTELQRRGVEIDSTAWSAAAIRQAPEILLQIHQDYVDAGAEIITANTFRTHARSLRASVWADAAGDLTLEAVEIARQAAQEKAYVAGCIAPLEDCYSPAFTPSSTELEKEHAEMVRHLVNADVDLILIETQITIREATIAATQASKFKIPFLISFTCRQNGTLFSGESLAEAVKSVLSLQPAAVLVNCIPTDEVIPAMRLIQQALDHNKITIPVLTGAYANTGRLMSDGSWASTDGKYPAVYAEFTESWKEFGIKLIGGCCGTTPEHIESIHQRLYGNGECS